MSESATHVDHEKLSLLLDKARQIAGESEDERNPDAQRSTSNAQRPTSATAAVPGSGVPAALVDSYAPTDLELDRFPIDSCAPAL